MSRVLFTGMPLMMPKIVLFLAMVTGDCFESIQAAIAGGPKASVSRGWDWSRPPYRSSDDCGPQSLYAFLRLNDVAVTMEFVRANVPLTPGVGCSIEDLRHAASLTGLRTRVVFVHPNRMSGLPRPFLLHGQQGLDVKHGMFCLVVDYDESKEQYAVIEPTHETLRWIRKESIEGLFTGYALVPDAWRSFEWYRWVQACAYLLIGATILILVHPAPVQPQSELEFSGGGVSITLPLGEFHEVTP